MNPKLKLLFICTHNRCRSILAEAIARNDAGSLIEAASAGSEPAGEVHPLTLHYLQQQGINIEGLHSKSWDDLGDFVPDYVITVCDSAAGESCPLWLGAVPKVHWGLADPSANLEEGTSPASAFINTINTLRLRLARLSALLQEPVAETELHHALQELGECYAAPGRKDNYRN